MEKKTKKISQAEYKEFIENLNLASIDLVRSRFAKDEDFFPPARITLKDQAEFRILDPEKGLFCVLATHSLQAAMPDSGKPGLKIDATFRFCYRSKVLMTRELFAIFSKQSLVLHSWPYFRQFVQDMSARASLPPLTLDVIRVS